MNEVYEYLCKQVVAAAYMTMNFPIREFLLDEQGQDVIEYALVLVFIGLGAIFSMKTLANSIATLFGGVGNTITNAV